MTPQEKARELVDKFTPFCIWNLVAESEVCSLTNAKRCALISSDELIKNDKGSDTDYVSGAGYWQQVKREIEKL